jgi:hypothetical protein
LAVVEDCESAGDGGAFPRFELDCVFILCWFGFGFQKDAVALAGGDLEERSIVWFCVGAGLLLAWCIIQ